jgi:hypothetical protein
MSQMIAIYRLYEQPVRQQLFRYCHSGGPAPNANEFAAGLCRSIVTRYRAGVPPKVFHWFATSKVNLRLSPRGSAYPRIKSVLGGSDEGGIAVHDSPRTASMPLC